MKIYLKSLLRIGIILIFTVLTFSLTACASILQSDLFNRIFLNNTNQPESNSETKSQENLAQVVKIAESTDQKILATGKSLIGLPYGQTNIEVAGKKFNMDCIGIVAAIYWGAGIDISADFKKYSGNGVARLYESLKNRKTLRDSIYPHPGDIIFWDNTWDKNNDGQFGNDFLTHAGVVVKVEEDGTIHYIHANFFSGVTIEYMNLEKPNVYKNEYGKIINSPLYLASSFGNPKNPPKWTSGELFRVFGDGLKTAASFGTGNSPDNRM